MRHDDAVTLTCVSDVHFLQGGVQKPFYSLNASTGLRMPGTDKRPLLQVGVQSDPRIASAESSETAYSCNKKF